MGVLQRREGGESRCGVYEGVKEVGISIFLRQRVGENLNRQRGVKERVEESSLHF